MIDTHATSHDAIAELLEGMRRHRLPLQVRVNPGDEDDLSLVLAVDRKHNAVYLDAPRHMDEHRFLPGQHMEVTVWDNGIQLRYRILIRERTSFEDYPALLTDWPETIETIQRRKAYRVRLRYLPARAEFYLHQGFNARGRILDISVDGFAALMDPDVPLEIGNQVDCEIGIAEKELFSAIAVVRNLNTVSMGTHTRVGAEFTNMESGNRQRLEKLVREFEREQIRNLRGQDS